LINPKIDRRTPTVPPTVPPAARGDGVTRFGAARLPAHPDRGLPAFSARQAAGPVREAKPSASANTLAEKVVAAFNTWAFKREQPSDLSAMTQAVAGAVGRGEPVGFVLYWGKGRRCFSGEPEAQALDYLARLGERIKSVYAGGASFTLILTDTHAALNGHLPACIDQYYASVEARLGRGGFSTCRLSRLVADLGAHEAPDDEVCMETVRKLEGSAGKWYRGDGTAEDGALRYYRLNMVERRAVEHAFPRSIFITYNGSELRRLFPQRLPIFHMYSLRRGVGVKPWFLAAEVPACGHLGCTSASIADLELERT
jgi:hypothetical protein